MDSQNSKEYCTDEMVKGGELAIRHALKMAKAGESKEAVKAYLKAEKLKVAAHMIYDIEELTDADAGVPVIFAMSLADSIVDDIVPKIFTGAESQHHKVNRMNEIKTKYAKQHQPAPEGTVKELAKKYNKSVSEIRRLKAAGRLSELSLET